MFAPFVISDRVSIPTRKYNILLEMKEYIHTVVKHDDYCPPASEVITLSTNSLICESANGNIEDLSDDIWRI